MVVNAQIDNRTLAKNRYMFSAQQSGSQALAAGWDKLDINAELYDPNGNYDNSSNYRYTAPINGYYLVGATVQIQVPNGRIMCSIWKNGSADAYRGEDTESGEGATVCGLIQLNAGEYIEAYSFLDNTGDTDASLCKFWAVFMSK